MIEALTRTVPGFDEVHSARQELLLTPGLLTSVFLLPVALLKQGGPVILLGGRCRRSCSALFPASDSPSFGTSIAGGDIGGDCIGSGGTIGDGSRSSFAASNKALVLLKVVACMLATCGSALSSNENDDCSGAEVLPCPCTELFHTHIDV